MLKADAGQSRTVPATKMRPSQWLKPTIRTARAADRAAESPSPKTSIRASTEPRCLARLSLARSTLLAASSALAAASAAVGLDTVGLDIFQMGGGWGTRAGAEILLAVGVG